MQRAFGEVSVKRRNHFIALVLAVAALALWWASSRDRSDSSKPEVGSTTEATPASEGAEPLGTTGELLVDLVDDATGEQVNRVAREYGLRLRPNSRFSEAVRLYRTRTGRRSVRVLLERLRRDPLVERAELDQLYSIPPLEARAVSAPESVDPQWKGFPNDPKYRYQWHMRQIGMQDAWRRAQGEGVIVAVIDTGVAYKDKGKTFRAVPDLAKTEVVRGYDFVNDDEEALDDHGHGTHVAGTIAQSTHNGVGVAGVAFGARIMPLKVLSKRGFGNVADIAEAVRFAADNGAKVINMSLGGPRSSRVLQSAVKYAQKKGVLVVCAAGNDGRGRVSYPAAYPGAVAVAATQFDRTTTFYSNWGKEIALAAPGGNTRVDQNNDGVPDGVMQNTIVIGKPDQNDYLLFMGTSMATPHVAGVAALVVGSGVSEPAAVLEVLTSTANHPKGKQRDDHYGAGIIDAEKALAKVQTEWNVYRGTLGTVFGLLLLAGLWRRGQLGLRLGPSLVGGLVLGATGLFFLPLLGVSLPQYLAPLARGFPAWDGLLLGASHHANPLFYSVAAPLVLTLLLYGVRRLRGLLFGFAIGVAAHLFFSAFSGASDVTWIPNLLALDQLWLIINGIACLALAKLIATE
jgi:serine protease